MYPDPEIPKGIRVLMLSASWLLVSCASINCGHENEQHAVLRVAHLSGGTAPVIYLLSVFDGGAVTLEKIGFRTHCAKVPEVAVLEIQEALQSEALRRTMPSGRTGFDWEEVHIEARNLSIKMNLTEVPSSLISFLRAVDRLFLNAFGDKYDMPFIQN